jgi:hypothetical protein
MIFIFKNWFKRNNKIILKTIYLINISVLVVILLFMNQHRINNFLIRFILEVDLKVIIKSFGLKYISRYTTHFFLLKINN